MSVEQVESAILEMSPQDRQRLLAWLDKNRRDLFVSSAEHHLTEAQKAEILRRRQDYRDHPETFIHVEDEGELDRFFKDIRHEVQARLSSARKG